MSLSNVLLTYLCSSGNFSLLHQYDGYKMNIYLFPTQSLIISLWQFGIAHVGNAIEYSNQYLLILKELDLRDREYVTNADNV